MNTFQNSKVLNLIVPVSAWVIQYIAGTEFSILRRNLACKSFGVNTEYIQGGSIYFK